MKTRQFLSILFLVICITSRSFSQLSWQPSGHFDGMINLIYFIDEFNGFANVGTAPGGPGLTPQLFRTSDGGKTWTLTSVAKLSGPYGIQDMVMTDSLNGWACGGSSAGYSVWCTVDGGWTWQTTSTNDRRYSVAIRVTGAGIVVSDFYNNGNGGEVRISTDGGKSFVDVFHPSSSDNMLGMDFSDALHGVIVTSFRSGNVWNYTTDGGLTWMPSNLNTESWSVVGEKGTPNFFATPEGWSNVSSNTTTSYRSTDFGRSWNAIGQIQIHGTGSITAINGAIYMQGQGNQPLPSGIFRSIDSGLSWQLLGGPAGFGDTRFAVCPSKCHTNVIYAAGTDQVVYKAYDESPNNMSRSTTQASARYQGAPSIHPADTANVQCNVHFVTGSPAIGFIPTEAEFSMKFDPNVVEISHGSDIHAPAGWMKKSFTISYDSVDVVIADTSVTPVIADQNFGSVAFFALPVTKRKSAGVSLSTLILRNDCTQITCVPDRESGILRIISIEMLGVEKIVFDKQLHTYPNPASKEMMISCDAMKEFESEIMIYDVLGRTVFHTKSPLQLTGSYSIALNTLPAGWYNLTVRAGSTFNKKFEIVK